MNPQVIFARTFALQICHQGKATLKPPRNTRPNQALIHPITLQLPKCNFF